MLPQVIPSTSSERGFLSSLLGNLYFFQYLTSSHSKESSESSLTIILEMSVFNIRYSIDHGDIYRLLVTIFSSVGGIYMIMFVFNTIVACFSQADVYEGLQSGGYDAGQIEVVELEQGTTARRVEGESLSFEEKVKKSQLM